MRKTLACLFVVLFLGLPGCSSSVPVDHDSNPETPDKSMDAEQIARWEVAQARAVEIRDAEAKAQAERDITSAQRDAERAVRRAVTLSEESVRDIEDSLADRIDTAASGLARTRLDNEEYIRRIADAADSARSDLAKQSAWIDSVGSVIGDPATAGLASMVPGCGAILGLIGAGFGLFQRAKATTAAKEVRVATRVIDAIDIAKEKDPLFAGAFKKHKDTLKDWMGEEGVALVNRLQSERA